MSNSNEHDHEQDGDDDYVEYAYQTAFGRNSDAEGKAYWQHELQSGHIDRASLLDTFSAYPEAREHVRAAAGSASTSTSTTLSDDDYVEYAYQTAFGRNSDAEGKAYWQHELQSGHVDRASLLDTFSTYPEAREHVRAAAGSASISTSTTLSDDDYVEYAYQTAFGRNSDAEGKAYWQHELQSGHVDRASLLDTFSAYPEAQEHLSLIGVSTITHDLMLLG